MKNFLIILIFAIGLSSCATLPKASVDLSVMLEQQISALESTNVEISKLYFELKRENAIQFLDEQWYPCFLDNLFQEEAMTEHWDSILVATNATQKIVLIKELTEVIQKQYMLMRDSLLNPLNQAEKDWLEFIRQEYQLAKTMNSTITQHVKSIHELQGKRKEILSKLVDNNALQEKLDIFISKADAVLENVEKGLTQYKQNEPAINQFINKIIK